MQLNNKYFQSRSQSPRILGQRLSNAQNPGQNEESEPEILLPVYGARARSNSITVSEPEGARSF